MAATAACRDGSGRPPRCVSGSEVSDMRTEGFALVGVLAVILIAGGIVATLTATTIDVSRATQADHRRLVLKQRLLGLARAGAVHARSSLDERARADAGGTHVGPAWVSCSDAQGTYRVQTIDHSGLIDVNAASVPLLALGFRALGYAAHELDALAATVLRHRTPLAVVPSEGGGEILHGPKGAPLESVRELADITALRSVDDTKLLRTFTVWSGSGALHLDHAPQHIRAAIDELRLRGEPMIVDGVASRQPALTTHVIWRAAPERHTLAGPHAFGVLLETRGDAGRAGGLRTLSATTVLSDGEPRSGHPPSSTSDCPGWLAAALEAMGSPRSQGRSVDRSWKEERQ